MNMVSVSIAQDKKSCVLVYIRFLTFEHVQNCQSMQRMSREVAHKKHRSRSIAQQISDLLVKEWKINTFEWVATGLKFLSSRWLLMMLLINI